VIDLRGRCAAPEVAAWFPFRCAVGRIKLA
jgi:hypothetical protein